MLIRERGEKKKKLHKDKLEDKNGELSEVRRRNEGGDKVTGRRGGERLKNELIQVETAPKTLNSAAAGLVLRSFEALSHGCRQTKAGNPGFSVALAALGRRLAQVCTGRR